MVRLSAGSISGTSLRVRLTRQAEINPASKFFYLKEFLVLRIKLLIDGLSFTSEDYLRAKSILYITITILSKQRKSKLSLSKIQERLRYIL